jgi:hypothetical protein
VVPDNLFVDGFEYQRTDGFDWYKKTLLQNKPNKRH